MAETLSPVLSPDLEERVGRAADRLCKRGLTVATAESCSAGLIAAALSDVDGKGHALEAGFVVYSDEAKSRLLGLSREMVDRHGPVSEAVARAMAEAALARSGATLALSVTGFAGPAGPGDEEGLVFFALAARGQETTTSEAHFGPRGRGAIRLACLRTALDLLDAALSDA